MTEVPDYRYWTADAIRAGSSATPSDEADDAPPSGPLIRPFAAFVAEAAPPAPELPAPAELPAAAPAPVVEQPAEVPLPSSGPLRRAVRPPVPAPVAAEQALGPTPEYRSGYGPQPARFPDVGRVSAPPARRRGTRVPLLLSYLVVIALTAVAAHLYWPQPAHRASAAVDSTSAGVLYTSRAGHFRARFPATPASLSDQTTVVGSHLVMHGAADAADQLRIAEVDLSRPVPPQQAAAFLAGVLRGVVGANATVRSERATTFQGHPARQGSYAADGSAVSVLAVLTSSTRAYVIDGPTGAKLTALQASFVALP